MTELRRRNVLRVAAAYIVTAWLVIQVVETILPAFGFGDVAVRYVTIAFAVGLLPALVLAWVFELTPEGLKKDAEFVHDHTFATDTAKRLDRIILAVLALALGYFAFDKFILDPARDVGIAEAARKEGRSQAMVESYGDRSIAVLAFRDMSPDKDQDYLSEGIAEEILHLLAQIPELRVISRSSAFFYKDTETPIPVIAEQLKVAHVLEGSVRKAGDRIRITAQLIEARSDTHVWSQTYDRRLEDIFAIQDEVAAAMVEQLELKLVGELPPARRIDPEAYLLYLEGHYNVAYVDNHKAVLLLERALEIEPDFAGAWWDLSRAYYQMSPTVGQKDHEGDEYWFKSAAARQRLLEIDPEHPAAQVLRAWFLAGEIGNFREGFRLLETAIERHPDNWDVIRMAANMSGWIRRDDVALALLKPVINRDPLCTDCSYRYARAALQAGHYEEAEQEILRLKALVPGAGANLTLSQARLLAGDIEGARAVFSAYDLEDLSTEDKAYVLYGLLLVRLMPGESEAALEDIANLAELNTATVGPSELANLYALAGRADEAFAMLEQLQREATPFAMASATHSPFLKNLHGDPRWMELLEYAGVAPQQLAEIEFDPQLPADPGSE